MPINSLPDKTLAFHLFMLEYSQDIFKSGQILSYDELRQQIIPRWNQLPRSKRDDYKQKAISKGKEIKDKIQKIHDRDAKEASLKREIAIVKKQRINEYLQKKTENNYWKSKNIFVLADFNIFAKFKEHVYPAEMALCKFTLNKGILDLLHMHIELDTSTDLPSGLLHTAKMTSEDTHQIPLPPDARQGHFKRITLKEAKKFVYDFLAGEIVVFALQEMMLKHDVLEVVERSFLKCFDMKVTAASLGEILKALKNQERYHFMNVDKMLIENPLENCASIGCMHHFEVDGPKYCSLARVKRWAYQLIKLALPHEEKGGNQIPHLEIQPNNTQLIFGFRQEAINTTTPDVLAGISNVNKNENSFLKLRNLGYKKEEHTDLSDSWMPEVMLLKHLNAADKFDEENCSKVKAHDLSSKNVEEDSFDETDLSNYMIDDDGGSDDTLTDQSENHDATVTEQQMTVVSEDFSSLEHSYFTDDTEIDECTNYTSIISSSNSKAFSDNFTDCSIVSDAAENCEEFSEYDFDELLG